MALNQLISETNEPQNQGLSGGTFDGVTVIKGDIHGGILEGPLEGETLFPGFPGGGDFIIPTKETIANCLSQTKYAHFGPGVPYDNLRILELKDCPGSPVRYIHYFSYGNSLLSVLAFLISGFILCRKLGWKSAKYPFLLPFFYGFMVIEAIYTVTRHIEQKTAFPIMDMKIWSSVTWYGWYRYYGNTTNIILEQTMRSSIEGQSVVFLFFNIGIIVNLYNSKRLYFSYIACVLVFISMQIFGIYMRINKIMLYSFVPVIFAQLSCVISLLLYRFITQSIFFKMDLVEAERQRGISYTAAVAVWLNWAIVSPKGVAWCVIIATYWFINGKVSFHTTLYEGYLVLGITEIDKWFSTLKFLLFWYTLKK